MEINQAATQLRQVITQFIGFKDYTEQGIIKLKQLESTIINFSKTPHCLSVSLIILEKQTVSEIQYFASMLLKDKLKFDFDQLDRNKIEQVHSRIICVIAKYMEPTKIVLTNLCLCLVYIYMHCAQLMGDPLRFLQISLSQVTNPNYLLKTLQMLPQQIDNSKVVIDDDLRDIAQNLLQNSQRTILVELNKVGQQLWDNEKVNKRTLLNCFKNWIDMKYDHELVNSLTQHQLLNRAIISMQDPYLSQDACECIAVILNKIRNPSQNLDLFNHLAKFIDIIVQKVGGLIQQNQTDIAQNYVKILCDFGMKAKTIFINNFNQKIKIFLQKLLQFMKQQQLSCFASMGDFWIVFLRQLQQSIVTDDMRQIIKKLYSNVCLKIIYPYKYIINMDQLSQDRVTKLYKQADDIRDWREFAKEIFQRIVFLLGKEQMLHQVCNNLQKLNMDNPAIIWPSLEVYIVSLAHSLDQFPTISEELIMIIQTFQKLNPKHVAIRRAYLSLFKTLMTIKQKDPIFIKQLFMYIGSMLAQPLLADKAEKAFQKACSHNPVIVCQNIQDFLVLLKNHWQKVNILKGVLGILNSNDALMKMYLPAIFSLYCEQLDKSKNAQQNSQTINFLMIVVKTITKPQPHAYEESVKNLLNTIWPKIKLTILNPPALDDDQDPTVQRCVRFLKVVMRSIKNGFLGYINQIFQTTIEAYKKYPVSSYLYLLQVSITVYYQNYQYLDYFKKLYCTFCDITYTHLKNQQKLIQYQFLVDDFLGMNKRFFIYNAQIALGSNKFQSILDLCQMCSGSDIHKISKASYQVIEIIYIFYWSPAMLQAYNLDQDNQTIKFKKQLEYLYSGVRQTIWTRTENLVKRMIDHLSRQPFQSTQDCILDALLAEIKAFPSENGALWSKLMPAIPQDILTRKQKEKFLLLLPKMSGSGTQETEKSIIRLLKTMNKRFSNRKNRQKLK